ncbi:MAG TPA: dihydrofolate reductase [Magnetospirillaceae bacterium]|nr:dihydrofolate reductase [Magnetospirillaceae bacterium]
MIAIVVATDKQRVIGNENKIPWRIRSDLVRLSNLTRGHCVVLGRVSYESMVWYYDKSGRDMPGGTYIVVTRDRSYKPARKNAATAHSVPEALTVAQKMGNDVYVIGGSSIFEEALPFVDRIYLTEVQTEVAGDSYFPPLIKSEWHETSHEHFQKDDRDEYDTDFIVLERVRS